MVRHAIRFFCMYRELQKVGILALPKERDVLWL